MGATRQQAEAGPAPAEGFHVHVETGRGRGRLTSVLVVPEEPVGTLARTLERLHDPRGALELDTRLGTLAAESPEGTAFLVGVNDQVWVFPSERFVARHVGGGQDDVLDEPQVVPLEPGESVELAEPSGEVVARIALDGKAAMPGDSDGLRGTGRSAQARSGAGPRRGLVVPAFILGAMIVALGIGLLRGEGAGRGALSRSAGGPALQRSTPAPPGPAVVEVPDSAIAVSVTEDVPAGPWVFRASGAITSSPLLVGARVVFGCRDSTLYCLDARSGQVAWEVPAGSGIGSSPRADGVACYVGTYDGKVLAADLESGEVRWEAATGGKIVSSPVVVGDRVIVGSHDRAVHGFDRDTGEKRWTFPTGGTVRASPEPVAEDVVVGSNDGVLYRLGARDGHLVWRARVRSPILGSCAHDAGRSLLVVGTQNGTALGLDAATGEIRWRASVGSEVNGQPRFAGDVVLVGTGRGALHALDPSTGEARWNASADRGFDARPLVVGTTVVAPSFDGVVHLLDLADGTVREERALGSEVFSSPAAGEDLVYLGTLGGAFHALHLP